MTEKDNLFLCRNCESGPCFSATKFENCPSKTVKPVWLPTTKEEAKRFQQPNMPSVKKWNTAKNPNCKVYKIEDVEDAKWIAEMLKNTVEENEDVRFIMELIGENIMLRAKVKDLESRTKKKGRKNG